MNGPFLHKFPFADYFEMLNRVSQHLEQCNTHTFWLPVYTCMPLRVVKLKSYTIKKKQP